MGRQLFLFAAPSICLGRHLIVRVTRTAYVIGGPFGGEVFASLLAREMSYNHAPGRLLGSRSDLCQRTRVRV
jgi:hypothetical protein